MFTSITLSRPQIAAAYSTTRPIMVGQDGFACFAAHNIHAPGRNPHFGLIFQMNLGFSPAGRLSFTTDGHRLETPHRSAWVPITNVGDWGRFERPTREGAGASVSGLTQGTWVRVHVFRLDGNNSSRIDLSVSTNSM